MADEADIAFDLEQARLAGLLSGRSAAIDPGTAGECTECGEDMPRLVGGRCGYCRDGRRPPLSRFDDAPRPRTIVAAAVPTVEIPMTVPNTSDKQTISVPAKGNVLAAIRDHADANDLPLGQAVIALVERAMAIADPSVASLGDFEIADLAAELCRRAEQGVPSLDFDAAIARAEAAEAKLASIQAALAS